MKSPFSKQITFTHSGHIGDIIAFIPIYRALQGNFLLVMDADWGAPMTGYKYDSLKPLLDAQGIESSMSSEGRSVDYDMSNWRECYRHEISLMDSQARFVHLVPRDTGHMEITEPWLKVEADPLTKGRVIINRTPRYRNPNFPWKNVLKHFGDKALFIGTEQEHLDYLCEVGNIEYYKTENCLDVARAIEGSEFFVGNQSSAFWIAAGLRKPLLQEMDLVVTNSVVPFDGAMYPYDCNVDFDKLPK
jgi:hypothetical protein